MIRPVLVDSAWYISQARAGRDPLRELAPVAVQRDLAVCGVVMVEVGRGLRDPRALERFQEAWDHMRYVPSDRDRWRETLQLAWQMDRAGQVLPLADLHIAACARHIGAVVLTVDAHFGRIPGITAVPLVV